VTPESYGSGTDREELGSSPVTSKSAERWGADEAVTNLYAAHYRALVRLATLLLHDVAAAEDVVQDAFVGMHRAWRRLRSPDAALGYLRQSVVNGARSALRKRGTATKYLAGQALPATAASAEHGALDRLDYAAVTAALRKLPDRQREALVLRYYGDLSEAQIAAAMGISQGAVKSHASRGMAALRTALADTVTGHDSSDTTGTEQGS
jgi:RNA polymerase sigma-70 factor (sigma-E family)